MGGIQITETRATNWMGWGEPIIVTVSWLNNLKPTAWCETDGKAHRDCRQPLVQKTREKQNHVTSTQLADN